VELKAASKLALDSGEHHEIDEKAGKLDNS